MKKIFVLAVAAAFSVVANAQSSSTSSTTSTGAASSSTSMSDVKPEAKKSNWSGGVLLLFEKDAINKDTNIRGIDEDGQAIISDNFDNDGVSLATQTHLSVGYKFNNGDKLKLIQRIYHSFALLSERQEYNYNTYVGPARLAYTTSGKFAKADASLTTRVAFPTTEDAWEQRYFGQIALIPSLNWEINPKWSVSYSGFASATTYHGNNNTPLSKWDTLAFSQGTDSYAAWKSRHSKGGAERSLLDFANSVAVNYNVSDTVSVSQSVGQNFGLKNYNYLKRYNQGWDLSTSVAWQPASNVGLELGVSQGIADMPGSVDPVSEKALYFDNYNVGLFRPEQTTYSLSTSITF